MNLLDLGFVIGFYMVVGVVFHTLLWHTLTRAARMGLFIMLMTGAIFAVLYTLTWTTARTSVKWAFALRGGLTPASYYDVLLLLAVAILAGRGLFARIPRSGWLYTALPLGLLGLLPFLRYVVTTDAYPTPTVIGDMLLTAALAGMAASLLAAVEKQTGKAPWRSLAMTQLAVTVVGIIWLFAMPAVRALRAETTAVEFDQVVLTGYELSPSFIEDETTINGTLYWELKHPAPADYTASIGVLPATTSENIARTDVVLRRPPLPSTTTWFPGFTLRTPFEISDIAPPEDTPAGYRITVSVREATRSGQTFQFLGGDREALTEETIILSTLPAVPTIMSPPPGDATAYTFDSGITLAAFTVEENDNTLKMQFWWQATVDITARYTQLLHLVPATGDGTPIATYDVPPFDGLLLTSDWYAGFAAVDTHIVQIPTDLSAGQYDLYTGLYDSVTLGRLAVRGANGAVLPDGQILIGTINRP